MCTEEECCTNIHLLENCQILLDLHVEYVVLQDKHMAAHDLSIKPQAHMALRTSPAGDL